MLLLLWTLLYFALLVLLTARITILFSDDVIFEKLVTRKLRDIACVHPWPDSWHHVNDATLPRDDPARSRVGNCTRANRAARFLVNLLDCPWCVSVWVAAPVAADLALGLSGAGLSPLSATSPLPEALWPTPPTAEGVVGLALLAWGALAYLSALVAHWTISRRRAWSAA